MRIHNHTRKPASNGPPGHRLAHPLRREQPVRRELMRWLCVRFYKPAVVEVIAIELNRVIRVDFRRQYLGLLLIPEAYPAVLTIPVLADLFAVVELDLDFNRHHEITLAVDGHEGLINRLILACFLVFL